MRLSECYQMFLLSRKDIYNLNILFYLHNMHTLLKRKQTKEQVINVEMIKN